MLRLVQTCSCQCSTTASTPIVGSCLLEHVLRDMFLSRSDCQAYHAPDRDGDVPQEACLVCKDCYWKTISRVYAKQMNPEGVQRLSLQILLYVLDIGLKFICRGLHGPRWVPI